METISDVLGSMQIFLQLATLFLTIDTYRRFQRRADEIDYVAVLPLVMKYLKRMVIFSCTSFALMAVRRLTALAILFGLNLGAWLGTVDRIGLPFLITLGFFMAVLQARLAVAVYLDE